MASRRRRVVRWTAVGAGLLVTAATPVWGPELGRRLPWFDVERVEIAGVRLLAPHELLHASGIRAGQSILDDPVEWEAALLRHPAIEEVRITRKAPGTIRIRVREKRPVAYVGSEVLAMATASGEVLPVDPSAAPQNLPIVRGNIEDPVEMDRVRLLLAETARLASADLHILSDVSEIRLAPGEEDILILVHHAGDIMVPFGASRTRLLELRAVLADLTRMQPVVRASNGARPRPTLDLRFDDQVVVRYPLPRDFS